MYLLRLVGVKEGKRSKLLHSKTPKLLSNTFGHCHHILITALGARDNVKLFLI